MLDTPPRAFHLDARACVGCKACQIACKDKHGLEVGRLWRRVYEVNGGGWRRAGAAWVSDVFAFHLSLSCNHCARPICAEVCPSRALRRRADGVVLLDTERCLGCSLCEWACPYGAPQYDAARGCMTKCTLCADELDAGRAPVCVTACPMRVLELGPAQGGGPTQDPLPDPRLTEPALVLEEHPAGARARAERIEVLPVGRHELHEWSLVAFTLLAQLAAGSALALAAAQLLAAAGSIHGLPPALSRTIWATVAVAMVAGLGISLRHLGRPGRAWRALANLRRSALSWEILAAVGLTAAGVLALLLGVPSIALTLAAALCALGLLVAMSRVYLLRTVPAWCSPRTPLRFAGTSLTLGSLALALAGSLGPGGYEPGGWPHALAAVGLATRWWAGRGPGPVGAATWTTAGALLLLAAPWVPGLTALDRPASTAFLVLACALVVASEVLERRRFYDSYRRCGL